MRKLIVLLMLVAFSVTLSGVVVGCKAEVDDDGAKVKIDTDGKP